MSSYLKIYNKFFLNISKEYATSLGLDVDNFVDLCKEVLKFQNAKFLQIDNEWKIIKITYFEI